jgi:hypothetical protein
MNSTRKTYRPRGNPLSEKVPLGKLAVLNFFPVSVFVAVTVTPGNEVFPQRTFPLI